MEKCSLWPVRQKETREGTKHPAGLGCAGFSLACLLIPWACLCVRDAPEQFMLELGGAFLGVPQDWPVPSAAEHQLV